MRQHGVVPSMMARGSLTLAWEVSDRWHRVLAALAETVARGLELGTSGYGAPLGDSSSSTVGVP